ncbi:MAG: tetratricopeptide repeat protein [Bacteroidales bacterium]|jgi:tetratricopeptide (TPR) repeat protein|nr:tetratricopeptide repeat protein [Bacteroidales bacterium]
MKYWDYIVDYLNGNLSSEESSQFERDLFFNNELLSEFVNVLELLEVAKEQSEDLKEGHLMDHFGEGILGILDLFYGIDSITGEILPDRLDLVSDIPMVADRYTISKKRKNFGKRLMAAAAIALVIVITTAFHEIVIAHCSNENLFEKYHQGIPFSVSRGGWGPDESRLDCAQILMLFYSGEFNQVATYARSLNDSICNDTKIKLAVAVSFQKTGDYDEAIRFFEMIGENNFYYSWVQWETALTYLRVGQIERATELLNRARKLDPFYEKKFKKIILCIRIRNVVNDRWFFGGSMYRNKQIDRDGTN